MNSKSKSKYLKEAKRIYGFEPGNFVVCVSSNQEPESEEQIWSVKSGLNRCSTVRRILHKPKKPKDSLTKLQLCHD